jgi:hypothetical protein
LDIAEGVFLNAIGSVLAMIFGSAVGLIFLALSLLALPLSVVAVMHLWGWEWWSALIGILIFICIPAFGQLGCVVLTIMGAYYVYQADFKWRDAAYPTPQTFSVATLTPDKFAAYKQTTLLPMLRRVCLEEAKKTNAFEGKVPLAVSNFCDCYVQLSVDAMTQDDLVMYERTKNYSDAAKKRIVAAGQRCVN